MSYSPVFPPHPHGKEKKRMKEKNKLEKFSLRAPGALGGCKWLL